MLIKCSNELMHTAPAKSLHRQEDNQEEINGIKLYTSKAYQWCVLGCYEVTSLERNSGLWCSKCIVLIYQSFNGNIIDLSTA